MKQWSVISQIQIPFHVDLELRKRGDFHLAWFNERSFVLTFRHSSVVTVDYSLFLFDWLVDFQRL